MKKLFAFLMIMSLGLVTLGCGDTSGPVKPKPDAAKPDPATTP